MARQLTLAQEAEQAAASIGNVVESELEKLRAELARVEAGGSLPPMIHGMSRNRYLVRLRAIVQAGEKQLVERPVRGPVEIVSEILASLSGSERDVWRKAAVDNFGEAVVREAEKKVAA